jgi:hypothetical protein
MTNPTESLDSAEKIKNRPPLAAWVKVSGVAAVSALAGGLAAAWYYRNTLKRLQNGAEQPSDTNFGISDNSPEDDV